MDTEYACGDCRSKQRVQTRHFFRKRPGFRRFFLPPLPPESHALLRRRWQRLSVPRCTADADRKLLSDAVGMLSQRERAIITMRFGLWGQKELTQKEVADRLGISQSYISRLEKRIILRLRREIVKMS